MSGTSEGNTSSSTPQGTILVLDSNPNLPPQHYLMSLLQLQTLSKCVQLLVESNIANNISSTEPIDVSTLAKRLGYNETNLYRILSFVASHGVLKETERGTFIGTQFSDVMRDDKSENVAGLIRHIASRHSQLPLLDMGITLKTGEPSFDHVIGTSFYEYLAKNPDARKEFDNGLGSFSGFMQNQLVKTAYDFSRFPQIVEIGGGRGGLLEKILRNCDKICATLIERPAALPNVFPELETPPLNARFKKVAGDALVSIDAEGDLFLIANMLLNFTDENVVKILANVAKAMARSQTSRTEPVRLLIVEGDLASNLQPNEPSLLKRGLDLMMMYTFAAQSRSTAAWEKLFEKSGLKLGKTVKIPPMNIAYECQLH